MYLGCGDSQSKTGHLLQFQTKVNHNNLYQTEHKSCCLFPPVWLDNLWYFLKSQQNIHYHDKYGHMAIFIVCEMDNTIILFPSLYFYLDYNVINMWLWPHYFPDGIVNFPTIILWIFVCYIIIIIKSEIWITSHRLRLGHKTVTCVVCLAMVLTHWGRDNMATISQTILSNAFSWMKMLEFRLKFHWCLFLRIELTIFQHWFR